MTTTEWLDIKKRKHHIILEELEGGNITCWRKSLEDIAGI